MTHSLAVAGLGVAGVALTMAPATPFAGEPGADHYIEALDLAPHPEGGYYRRSYEAADTLPAAVLPDRYDGPRPAATAIHFLLERGQVSALHRLQSDELWHFYAGDPLRVHVIDAEGAHREIVLGPDLDDGMVFQALVPHGAWFGAELAGGPHGYALVGNTVAPGFDFADFELAEREALIARYPEHETVIRRLTH